MTDDAQTIREIRERADAATPGPWKIDRTKSHKCIYKHVDGGSRDKLIVSYPYAVTTEDAPNLVFIAHARADIDWLLADRELLIKKLANSERDRKSSDRKWVHQNAERLIAQGRTEQAEKRVELLEAALQEAQGVLNTHVDAGEPLSIVSLALDTINTALGEPGSSAADADGAAIASGDGGHHESVGERQGRQPDSLNVELLEAALREADLAASVAHDFVWGLKDVTQAEADAAIWRIHNVLRPALSESGSSAADVDGAAGSESGLHESVGERQGWQPGSPSVEETA